MNRIVIGLTVSAVDKLVTNTIAFSKAKSQLFQHKILFSDLILDEYEKHFDEAEQLDLFQNWFKEINRFDYTDFQDSTSEESFLDELFAQIKTFTHKIIVFYDEKLPAKSDYHLIELNDLDSGSCENELAKYCMPYNSYIEENSSIAEFAAWLKDWLESEKVIWIFDRFFFKSKNKDLLRKVIFPLMPNNSKIHIYFQEEKSDQSLISSIKRQYNPRVQTHPSNPADFHDRLIVCDSFTISIGFGLDVFDYSSKQAIMRTTLSVYSNNGKKPRFPRSLTNRR